MAVIRKRLIFWLIKAYIKKSGKTLILCFLLGLLIFFAIAFSSKYFSLLIPFTQKQNIGIVGAYTIDTLPPDVVNNLSSGLTKQSENGTIEPNLAASWETQESGKIYIFKLKPNQYYNNGKEITSETITYDFADVITERPDKYTLVYKLKDAYSPFLVTATRPIFFEGFNGVGEYRIESVERNGNFVQSLTIAAVKNRQKKITYEFYPSEEALKTAFLLGEVSEIRGITNNTIKDTTFENFPNITVTKKADYSRLVTLFFNTTDGTLSDKKLRLSLTYALPDKFKEGDRAYLPYSPKSTFFNPDVEVHKNDYNHAKLLLLPAEGASGSASTAPKELTIKTLSKYRPAADQIAQAWKNIGIKTKIEEVDSIPSDYQIFLGDFSVPNDPDQYTLWHSDQRNNITRYKNLRIDKLLEDGRKTIDTVERKRLYNDFQKYLTDDSPAAFLYFPTTYSVTKK